LRKGTSLAVIKINACTLKKGDTMKLRCPAFQNDGLIPERFSCNNENINPSLLISNYPPQTKSFVLIVDDPDAPKGVWLHWLVYDISVREVIEQNSVPGKQGINDFGNLRYDGPCPGSGTHRYYFRLFALDSLLNLSDGMSREEIEDAMEHHILDVAEVCGLYSAKEIV
jgi:Raf kinase inhibitor-like YbhB/YbcL family protein